MITSESSLAEVCFCVSEALVARGLSATLTGGSAAAVYAPAVCASYDADFVLQPDVSLAEVEGALASIEFRRDGKSRMFVNPQTKFTIDFPRGPLAVGGDYVRDTAVLTQDRMTLRILTPTDCVRDRLAHFYHWNDFTALNAAVAVTVARSTEVDVQKLRIWSKREANLEKFEEYLRRIQQHA